ncbi:MAG TPA: methyltransferase domain-containing protein [Anaerolineae bacterium]|jgi:SAM-dependent methyltransferase|nr:methyltransferase domain-containing protein [Anaerolineae bacterium]
MTGTIDSNPDVNATDVNSSDFWDRLYQTDQFGWDLGGPTPVFRRLAESRRLKPAALLVLGAGRGHDARLFARHGFQVTAVDFSAEAAAAMKELADPQFPTEIVQADFFSLPATWNNRFDYILDYTSYCAILPDRRPEYADLVARLLKPGGNYIILAFPIGRRSGGPPYVVQPNDIVASYAERGFKLQHREVPAESVANRKGYEELLILGKT